MLRLEWDIGEIMPRYNVKNSKGQWACFSSIVDKFVTPFMPKDEYEQWRIKEYNYTEKDYVPAEKCNTMTLEEAIFSLSLNHTDKEIIENLAFAGLIQPLSERGDPAHDDEDK